jgi:hypothetical protein
MKGEQAVRYAAEKAKYGDKIKQAVASDLGKGLRGGGGCHWEPGADPSTAKCEVTNPTNPAYKGWGQPKESPMYYPGSAAVAMPAPPLKSPVKFVA